MERDGHSMTASLSLSLCLFRLGSGWSFVRFRLRRTIQIYIMRELRMIALITITWFNTFNGSAVAVDSTTKGNVTLF